MPGIEWLEEYTKIPVLGVIPWFHSALPAEDSLSLLDRTTKKNNHDLKINIIRLPRISNFTDFDPLEAEDGVFIEYLKPEQKLGYPDAIILPGTKMTIADLLVLQQTAHEKWAGSNNTPKYCLATRLMSSAVTMETASRNFLHK